MSKKYEVVRYEGYEFFFKYDIDPITTGLRHIQIPEAFTGTGWMQNKPK